MATKYISPTGSNGAAGTLGAPWQTLAYAISNTSAGDTIVCLDGTFTFATQTITNRIIQAQNNGKVIFDGAGGNVVWTLVAPLQVTGIEFKNVVTSVYTFGIANGFANGDITFTNCVFHDLEGNTSSNSIQGVFFAGNNIGSTGGTTRYCKFVNCLIYDIRNGSGVSNTGGLFGANSQSATNFIWKLVGTIVHLNSTTKTIAAFFSTYNGSGGAGHVEVDNSILFNEQGTPTYFEQFAGGTSTCASSCTYLLTSVPVGTGNITSDPKFVDPTNGIFRLRQDSPCLNAGVNL